jgi:hypothetical protein
VLIKSHPPRPVSRQRDRSASINCAPTGLEQYADIREQPNE